METVASLPESAEAWHQKIPMPSAVKTAHFKIDPKIRLGFMGNEVILASIGNIIISQSQAKIAGHDPISRYFLLTIGSV